MLRTCFASQPAPLASRIGPGVWLWQAISHALEHDKTGSKLLVELEGILVTGFLRRFPLLAR